MYKTCRSKHLDPIATSKIMTRKISMNLIATQQCKKAKLKPRDNKSKKYLDYTKITDVSID